MAHGKEELVQSESEPSHEIEDDHYENNLDDDIDHKNEKAEHSTAGYFSKAPLPPIPDMTRELVVMIAGDSGLGKSTFINTLFDLNMIPKDQGAIFAKTLEVTEHKDIIFGTVSNQIKLTVIDTPGWGDHMNIEDSLEIIITPLKKRLNQFKLDERNPGADCRVKIIFYFVAPHRLKPVDVECMKALQKYSTIIPVLAKADAMTIDELNEYRTSVRKQLQEAGIELFRLADIEPPFAVIGSPKREYAWGTAKAETKEHSDLLLIKEAIGSRCFHIIQSRIIDKYEQFKAENTIFYRVRDIANPTWKKLKTVLKWVLFFLVILLSLWPHLFYWPETISSLALFNSVHNQPSDGMLNVENTTGNIENTPPVINVLFN